VKKIRRLLLLFVILLALSILLKNNSYIEHILFMAFLYGMLSGSWNLSAGYSGEISLGHTIFFGIGAYTSSLLFINLGVSPWIGMIIGAILAVIFSLVFGGILLWRLESHFFTLATLALAEIFRLLIIYFQDFTGGAEGIPLPAKGGGYNFIFESKFPYVFITLLLFIGVTIISYSIKSKKLGFYLTAIKADKKAAKSLGINPLKYKVIAYALSAFFVALGGTVFVQYTLFNAPEVTFSSLVSIKMALYSIIGGLGTVEGPLLGALALVPLDIVLSNWLGGELAGIDIFLYGFILVIVVLYFPNGIVGEFKKRFSGKNQKENMSQNGSAKVTSFNNQETKKHLLTHQISNSIIFSAKNLNKSFGGLQAVKDLSFDIKKGEILGIIGPNGAGKTTLFNIITNFLSPDSGQIIFKGEQITGKSPYEICLNHHVARTFQITKSFKDMTVLENVMVGVMCRHGETSIAKEKAKEIVDFVGLTKYIDTLALNLPIALKRRVEIGRALATEPEMFLLDENMAGLTPEEINEAIELIKIISNQGINVVLIEHVMAAVMNLSDRILVLDHGEKIAEGTPEEIINNDKVIQVYMGKSFKKEGSSC